MIALKHLSAGLIGIAMLTTPAMARDNIAADRHVVRKVNAHPAGHWNQGHPRIIPAMFHSSPRNEPGGVCDHGDNPMIC